MNDLSFHFLASHNWPYAQEIIRAAGIRSAFLLDPTIDQISFSLQHVDFLVVRIFDPFNEYHGGSNPNFEKDILNNHSSYEFVQWLNTRFSAFKGNSKIRWVLGWNELYSKRGQAEREQNHKMTAIARAMVTEGYGVGLGGWAADKSFYQEDIEAGHWDEIILFAVANRDWVSFDVHEYTVGRIAQQHLKSHGTEGYPACLLNPQLMAKSNWGTIAYSGGGATSRNWHIGRTAWILERAESIAGQTFCWYRGECAHDFKDDGILKDFINNEFIPRFGKPRGINTLFDYYQYLAANGDSGYRLTNDKFNEMLFEDYAWLAQNSPPCNRANFIFAHNGGWSAFDTSIPERLSFVQRIMNHVTEETLLPDDSLPFYFDPADYAVYAVKSTTGGKVRARDYYGLNSAILDVYFDPEPKEVALIHPNRNIEGYPPIANGYTWVYAVHEGGIGAWSAWELLSASPVNPPPPPPSEDYEAMIEAIRAIVCQ